MRTSKVILFNKPFHVLCQFSTPKESSSPTNKQNLSDYIPIPNIYPAGRLDYDSEGLLLLTDDGKLQHRLAHPKFKQPKTYWVQVEGVPDSAAIAALQQGVMLKDGLTQAATVSCIDTPKVWPRNPPIRFRANIPTQWLSITLTEGRNRQVRRMTAAVGHPTLRLIRWSIGEWCVGDMLPGDYRQVKASKG